MLLNHLDVDEAAHFKIDAEYLDLLTVSELESLAEESKLRRAMGEGYKKARAGTKSDFIAALLAAPGVSHAGLVPGAMRYPRRKLRTPVAGREARRLIPGRRSVTRSQSWLRRDRAAKRLTPLAALTARKPGGGRLGGEGWHG